MAFPKGAEPFELPEFIYESAGKYRLLISVLGKQHFLGAWNDIEIAKVQRDFALHSLKPWLRCKLPELTALEDLSLLDPNPRLESLLGRLAGMMPDGVRSAEEREREGVVTRLVRIEDKLTRLIELLEARR